MKPANVKPTKHSRLCSAHFEKTFDPDSEKMAAGVGLSSLRSQLYFKKANFKPTVCSLLKNLFRPRTGPEKMMALGYPGAQTSLKKDVVATLFPVVEAMLTPSIGRSHAATRASTTTVHLAL